MTMGSLLQPSATIRNPDVTREAVYQNHRVLRGRSAAINRGGLLTRASGGVLAKTAKFARGHFLKLLSAALLFGSWKLVHELNTDENAGPITKIVNTKARLQSMASAEAEWRFYDLFAYGPVNHVWGLWWYRAFQVPAIHDVLLKLLYSCINEPSFVFSCKSRKSSAKSGSSTAPSNSL